MEKGAEANSSSPGARLLVARTEAGLSATQAAERLHLDLATVDALEHGRFEGLGASVFVRGHLRRYAELVNVPQAEIMAAYDAWSGRLAAQPDLSDVITAPAGRTGSSQSKLSPRWALMAAIILVPLALIWWAVRMPMRAHADKTLTPAPAAAPVPVAVAAPVTVAPPHSAPAPVADAGPGTAATLPPVYLKMKFTQDSWIEIYDVRGAALYHGLALADSQHHVTGSAPLRVFLGNPMGVALDLDGHPVALVGSTAGSRPRRFLLDSSGRITETSAAASSPKAP